MVYKYRRLLRLYSMNVLKSCNCEVELAVARERRVIQIPNKPALNTTNAVSGPGSLGLQAEQCAAQYGRNPNFMLVDVSIMGLF